MRAYTVVITVVISMPLKGRQLNRLLSTHAREYVEKVNAPTKAFVEIRGGHFACYTDPEGFLGTLRQQVLPLCKA
jgi:hypothetical protein